MNSINEEQKQRINEDLQLLQYDGITWSANGKAKTLEEAIAEVEQEGKDIGFNATAQVFIFIKQVFNSEVFSSRHMTKLLFRRGFRRGIFNKNFIIKTMGYPF